MRRMRTIAVCVALVLLLLIAGCGGGGGGSRTLNMAGSGYLGNSADTVYSSGMYMDHVPFTATRNGTIVVTMSSVSSDPLDPKLYVVNTDLSLIGEDDDSGEGLNAVYSFTAVAGRTYYAWFSTAYRYDSGSYTYTITEVSSRESGRSLSPNASEHKDGVEITYEDVKHELEL